MLTYVLIVLFFFFNSLVFSENLEVNGDFERVVANKNGLLMPDGWHLGTSESKNCTVMVIKNSTDVYKGNFSLWIEGEETKNRAYLYRYPSRVSVDVGDTLKMSIWAQGKGELALGVIASGTIADTGQTLGTRTLIGKRITVDSPDKWQKFEYILPVRAIKKDDLLFVDLSYVPLIDAINCEVLLLDDCIFHIERAVEKTAE